MPRQGFTVGIVFILVWTGCQTMILAADLAEYSDMTGGEIFLVLSNDAVQKELSLDDAARLKVRGLVKRYRNERLEAHRIWDAKRRELKPNQLAIEEFRSRVLLINEGYQVEFQTINQKFLLQLKTIISNDQLSRLKQISWQAHGSKAMLTDAELRAAINLTTEQIAQVTALNQEDWISRIRRPRPGVSQVDLNQERDGRAIQLLTFEQKEKYAQLLGNSFDLTLISPRLTNLVVSGETAVGNVSSFGVFSLIRIEDVQKEIGLNEEAAGKINVFAAKFTKLWQDGGGGIRTRSFMRANGSIYSYRDAAMPPWAFGEERKKLDEIREQEVERLIELQSEMMAKMLPSLKELLKADQFTRLQEIYRQSMGVSVFLDHDVIEAIGLTDEQQEHIASIVLDFDAVKRELARTENEKGGQVSEAKTNELIADRDAKISDLLSTIQIERLAQLKGKEFNVASLRGIIRGQ